MNQEDISPVSEAIWPWRERSAGGTEKSAAGSKRPLIESGVTLTVGLILLAGFHKAIIGSIVCAIAVFVLVSGLCIPRAYQGFRKLGERLAKAVGVALTWMLLAPFFYICFASAGIILRLLRRDPLQRAWKPEATTYWETHRGVLDAQHYDRQY